LFGLLSAGATCGGESTTDPEREAKRPRRPDAADADCSCGAADACYAAGYARLYGEDPDAKSGAAPCFRKACEQGNADACRGLAGMFDFGQGLSHDARRAREFWARAATLHRTQCDGGGMRDCFELGLLMFRGQGMAQDQADAARLFRLACDGGNANGCVELKLVCQADGFPACF
jgi:hypothetical protein